MLTGEFPMWKSLKHEDKPLNPPTQPSAQATTRSGPANPATRPQEIPKMNDYRSDVAHIGKSVVVKGELSGSEDLYLDGEVEGSIELRSHSLTIGPNGRVRANVFAKDIVIHGKVDGNVRGTDRVELKKSAVLNGDIATQRIVIEDGAYFKGSIDIQKVEVKQETPRVAAAAASAVPSTVHSGGQTPLLDRN